LIEEKIKNVLEKYEQDWKDLSPIVFKLSKLAEYVNIEEKMVVSPAVAVNIK